MRGRVPLAQPHGPAPPGGVQHIALVHGGESKRHGRHAIGEVERALGGISRQRRAGDPGAFAEGDLLRCCRFLPVEGQHPPGQPGDAGGEDPGALPGEAANQTDMVGMVVGHDDPADRFPGQRPGSQRRHGIAPARPVEPGIDQRPVRALVQRIDIDVVERHRQRQPGPEDTPGNLDRITGTRRIGPWVRDCGARGHLAPGKGHLRLRRRGARPGWRRDPRPRGSPPAPAPPHRAASGG